MPALAERLNSPDEIIEKLGKCEVEMKYDGFRMQCHKSGDAVELYSRKLERMTPMLPDVVDEIRKLPQKEIIFEGEALAFDIANNRFMPFQQTMHRRRKHGIEEASKNFPLTVFVFDLIYLDGEDYTSLPYKKRRKLIEKTFSTSSLLKPSLAQIVETSVELDSIFKNPFQVGLKGLWQKIWMRHILPENENLPG